jgi:hypothetical protein
MARTHDGDEPNVRWRTRLDLTTLVAVSAFVLSGLSFYFSYLYTKQQLDVTVTDVSYATNEGSLYITVAFANGGNRDAALLRLEPAVWGRQASASAAAWVPLDTPVDPTIPLMSPKTPLVIKAGGVELVTLSAKLNPARAEQAVISNEGGAFIGIRAATMNSSGNLYLLEHPVARLLIDAHGRIHGAEAAIHQSLSGFTDVSGVPPGDHLQSNRKTPFVWADDHY